MFRSSVERFTADSSNDGEKYFVLRSSPGNIYGLELAFVPSLLFVFTEFYLD